jgi:hypothetical protein
VTGYDRLGGVRLVPDSGLLGKDYATSVRAAAA